MDPLRNDEEASQAQPLAAAALTGPLSGDTRSLWVSAFIELLPVAMNVSAWTVNGKPVHTGRDRINMAATWADLAVEAAAQRGIA